MGFIVAAATIMVLGLLWALRAVFLVCRDAGEEDTLFDQVLLAVPTAALSECSRQAESMFETAEAGLKMALELFQQYDSAKAQMVLAKKRELDQYEEQLSACIAKIPGHALSEEEVRQRVKLNLTIGNIQALGTCAVKLKKLAEEGEEMEVLLTEADRRDLLVVSEAMEELVHLLALAYHTGDLEAVPQAQALKKVIVGLLLQLKTSVVVCLKNGTISADACYVLSCVYMDCEDVLEIAQMIQGGIERTAPARRKKRSLREELTHGDADQTALVQYAIKYSI